MKVAVKRCMTNAHQTYDAADRTAWIRAHPNQTLLAVSQQQWTLSVHAILDTGCQIQKKLTQFEKKLGENLEALVEMARCKLNRLLRKIICNLITVDVHSRDATLSLIQSGASGSDDFNWLKFLRYYRRNDSETFEVKIASASAPYLYEYLGASELLVITPMTDRCFLSLMGAFKMDLGGAVIG